MSLFPVDKPLPFYAGFGNRATDIKSYLASKIPAERILIIDPGGSVQNAAHVEFKTNYDTMLKDNIVDCLFPPTNHLKRLENATGRYKEVLISNLDNLALLSLFGERNLINLKRPRTSTYTNATEDPNNWIMQSGNYKAREQDIFPPSHRYSLFIHTLRPQLDKPNEIREQI